MVCFLIRLSKEGRGEKRRRRWKEESGTAARGYYSEGTEQDEAVFSRAMESRCGKKKDEGGTGMILNTGNRTDIPAFYSAWLCNRIRAGFVCVRNPFHPSCVTRYRMDPELVDVLMFCTKNPAPALEYLSEFGIFRQLWFVTITPYGREIEPGVPEKREVIRSFRELSSQIGRKCVCWRYDPVFLSDRYSIAFHCRSFEEMASALSGAVEYCVVSFIDLYEKTRRNFPSVRAVTPEEQRVLVDHFVKTGKRCGIRIRLCCEDPGLAVLGADVSGCMSREVIEEAIGRDLLIPSDWRRVRKECRCLLGNDIGAYNSCPHGCVYCYANYDRKCVERNFRDHDPESPFLIGHERVGDIVRDAVQKSFLDRQDSLFSF